MAADLTHQVEQHFQQVGDLLVQGSQLAASFPDEFSWIGLETKIQQYVSESSDVLLDAQDVGSLARLLATSYQRIQNRTSNHKVACLGPPGSYTYKAAKKKLGGLEILTQDTAGEVFELLANEEVRYGVVAIENAIQGLVGENIDELVDYGFTIVAEVRIQIEHALLANRTLQDVETVYSHWQALRQCQRALNQLKQRSGTKIKLVEVESTSRAAKLAEEDASGKTAAIASRIAAEGRSLNVLMDNIEDVPNNVTRFFVIAKHAPEAVELGNVKCRTSINFKLRHVPGALCHALNLLQDVNLTLIQSRPESDHWSYSFFAEFDGHAQDESVKKCLAELEEYCGGKEAVRFFGSYPIDEDPTR
ncbi:MAG: hypothetical protein O3A00_02690 [Planctomycetota bacterium]|nr:hypothetical protein [Planctomycetota bacterium]